MSTDTDDLLTWVREQIAEDKRSLDTRERYDCDDAAHAIWTDERVLAQCDAHTMLLDSITARLGDADRLEQMGAQPADVSAIRAPAEWQLAVTALAYQHRPGYREEWKP